MNIHRYTQNRCSLTVNMYPMWRRGRSGSAEFLILVFKTPPRLTGRRTNKPHWAAYEYTREGWTATRKASWEMCMHFADWLHSRIDLSEVNISRIWKFSKDETIRL